MLWSVLRRVFSRARYVLIAVGIAFLALSVAILLPNTAIIVQILGSAQVDVGSKLAFLGSMYGALFTNFTVLSALFTVAIALLFGVNSALLAYYIRRRQRQVPVAGSSANAAGILGAVSGVFGIGCAACGSVIISGVLTLLGGGWLLAFLPLHGAEFGLLGVLLLSFSVYQLSKRINDPLVCPV